jgi:serine/threonine-protein kinase HipA
LLDRATLPAGEVIIKTGGDEYEGLAENEFHCMSIAAAAGLNVPRFWLSENKELFVVERFDREEGRQLGFEDMTSLMGLQNEQKYDSSYEMVAKAITLNVSETHKHTSLTEFYKSLVLSVMLRNGDAHLKNFGLIYTTPQTNDCRLSPLYDVVNTTMYLPKDTLALKLRKTKVWPSKDELVNFGRTHCAIDRPERIIEQIADVAMSYQPHSESNVWTRMRPEIERGCKL